MIGSRYNPRENDWRFLREQSRWSAPLERSGPACRCWCQFTLAFGIVLLVAVGYDLFL